jgi:predicted nucleotidyltransferase
MSNIIKKLLREGLFIDAAINEITDDLDFSSFKVNKILNPKVWESEDTINSEIRETLIKIAKSYYDSLSLNVPITDIVLTGSLANYNWSKYSDFDIHIVIDMNKFGDKKDLVKDLLGAKTRSWNDNHDIKIKDYDVELYIQDKNEEHHSTGVYSLMDEKWVLKPEKTAPKINKNSVREKYKKIVDTLNDIKKQYKKGNEETVTTRLGKLKDRIKKMRQSVLESGGEFSAENIAFKLLRRNEIMTQIGDLMDKAFDKSMSLDEWLAQ